MALKRKDAKCTSPRQFLSRLSRAPVLLNRLPSPLLHPGRDVVGDRTAEQRRVDVGEQLTPRELEIFLQVVDGGFGVELFRLTRGLALKCSGLDADDRCGGASARTSARGAHARSAGGQFSARTSAEGAIASSEGGRASARTSARGKHARSAGKRESARTSARGAHARSAGVSWFRV